MSPSRIYVVAGPRACGKSTFIERCRSGETVTLPAELAGLASAQGPIYFMELRNFAPGDSRELLVHVDLLTPFADSEPATTEVLCSRMSAAMFEQYPGAAWFRQCRDLQILTLRVPRVVTLRRWLDRCVARQETTCRRIMAQLYSDAAGEAGYAALYAVWEDYVAGLANATAWNVSETHDHQAYVISGS